MGSYFADRFFSDFAIRTKENQKRIEYISDITVHHNRDLKVLYQMAQSDAEMKDVAKAVTGVALNNRQLEEGEEFDPETLRLLFSMHGTFERSSEEAYRSLGQRPPYYYFDGTQLLNSFLGLIVLPFERFRTVNFTVLEGIMSRDVGNYVWLTDLIDRLYVRRLPDDVLNEGNEFIFSSYYGGHDLSRDSRYKVHNLWSHLRNAFAHSGDGTLYFFPIAGGENAQDITHIAFYDTKEDRNNPGNHVYFLAKISVDNVREIARRMESIVRTVEAEDPRRHTHSPGSFEEAVWIIRNIER